MVNRRTDTQRPDRPQLRFPLSGDGRAERPGGPRVWIIAMGATEAQVLDGSKTVTRRMGFWADKRGRTLVLAGDGLRIVRKSMGRRRGGTVEPIVELRRATVTGVSRVRLAAIDRDDVAREGFPSWSPAEFTRFFCSINPGCRPTSTVTRIAYVYDDPETKP